MKQEHQETRQEKINREHPITVMLLVGVIVGVLTGLILRNVDMISVYNQSNPENNTILAEVDEQKVIDLQDDCSTVTENRPDGFDDNNEAVPLHASQTELGFFEGEFQNKYQEIEFNFIAPRTGIYSFYFTRYTEGLLCTIAIEDMDGHYVIYSSSFGERYGATGELEAGKNYTVLVQNSYKIGSFDMEVGIPKDPIDITGYTEVCDDIAYQHQINQYFFIPTYDGRYIFSLHEVYSGTKFNLEIKDHLGYSITRNGVVGNGGYLSADLNNGEKYTITVEQQSMVGSYKLCLDL